MAHIDNETKETIESNTHFEIPFDGSLYNNNNARFYACICLTITRIRLNIVNDNKTANFLGNTNASIKLIKSLE